MNNERNLEYFAENISRLHEVTLKYLFVREHILDNFIMIIFVKSCDNDSNIFTKNVSEGAYMKTLK